MPAPKRERWDQETHRLNETVANNRSHQAIKAARTRFENAHRAYWESCREALADFRQGMSLEDAANKHEVEARDVAELVGTEES